MNEYVSEINKEFGLSLTGLSPLFGQKKIKVSDKVKVAVVKDFGNGLGRVVVSDNQNRLVACIIERLCDFCTTGVAATTSQDHTDHEVYHLCHECAQLNENRT